MMAEHRKQVARTEDAPRAIGPYSQAVRADGWVMTAGQIGLDPRTGEIVEGGIQGQTRQVLTNLRRVLEAAESGLGSVIKTTVFLKDMQDFAAMNAIYAEFFPDEPPARSTVAVAELPKGALVEIEAMALTAGKRSK